MHGQTGDLALALVSLGLLAIGLLSIGLGRALAWYDRFHAWRERRRPVKRYAGRPRVVMSRAAPGRPPMPRVAPPVVPTPPEAGQLVAMPTTADNPELSDNDQLSAGARDIMIFYARVETIASLYKDGQISNLAKAIEKGFGCSRSSKEQSTYQRAKWAIEARTTRPTEATPIAGRETDATFSRNE